MCKRAVGLAIGSGCASQNGQLPTPLFDYDHIIVQDQLLTGADGLYHLQVHRVAAIRGNFQDPTDVLLPFTAGLRRVIRCVHIVRAIVAHVEAQVLALYSCASNCISRSPVMIMCPGRRVGALAGRS